MKKLERLDVTGAKYAYNFLKIRRCYDGSVRVFIARQLDDVGEKTSTPKWDSEDTVKIIKNLNLSPTSEDSGHSWIELTIINTD
jgi:hypothetical protein